MHALGRSTAELEWPGRRRTDRRRRACARERRLGRRRRRAASETRGRSAERVAAARSRASAPSSRLRTTFTRGSMHARGRTATASGGGANARRSKRRRRSGIRPRWISSRSGPRAAPLVGKHDFRAFTPTETQHSTFVRTVFAANWLELDENVVAFEITGDSFLRHMVRSLVGTMLRRQEILPLLAGRPSRSRPYRPGPRPVLDGHRLRGRGPSPNQGRGRVTFASQPTAASQVGTCTGGRSSHSSPAPEKPIGQYLTAIVYVDVTRRQTKVEEE